jgi:2-polyprenyl-3-methyl-5-hydroxy-6-metoxy-1,4-benzoquinol methylase
MKNSQSFVCKNCNSHEIYVANSYKHHCLICKDCSNVTHIKKKSKLFFEYFLPRELCKRFLPSKAFMRLFSDKGDFRYENFYDEFVNEANNVTDKRLSDIDQVLDTLNYFNYDIKGKKILDVSGGPGFVPGHLNSIALECCTTEHSELAANAISDKFNIRAKRFDYNSDRLYDIYNEKFDLILVRSSVIFCENVDRFLSDCFKMLNDDGCVLVESIIPSLGEVLWWQTLEYKFPRIHSQETLEKYFYKNKFSFIGGFREYEKYISVKNRSYAEVSKRLFVLLFDLPLYYLYFLGIRKSAVTIDQRNIHKMVVQFWSKSNCIQPGGTYRNFYLGDKFKSKHFGFVYNGYLKNFNNYNVEENRY